MPVLALSVDRDAMPNRASGNVRRNVGAGIIEVAIAAQTEVVDAMPNRASGNTRPDGSAGVREVPREDANDDSSALVR